MVGNLWEFSARKRRPAVLAPWERPIDKPVTKATPVAAGNRIPKGMERRFSQEEDAACAGLSGRSISAILNPLSRRASPGFMASS